MAAHNRLWEELDALAQNVDAFAPQGRSEMQAYHHVASRIRQALARFPDDGPELTLVAEVVDGRNYLLSVDRNISAEQADIMLRKLRERFPASTFAFLAPDVTVEAEQMPQATVGPHAVRLNDLADALNTVALQYHDYAVKAPVNSATGHAFSIAGNLALDLKQALTTPERDGAATPPAETPTGAHTPEAAESATGAPTGPAPSRPAKCGMPHPWLTSTWCTQPRLAHSDFRHAAIGSDEYRTTIRWSQP